MLGRSQEYESLETVQKQALYFDTDSVIYQWRPGQPKISLGDYLGEMTNELEGDDYIVEFTLACPKNYGYRTREGHVCRKVPRFTLKVRGFAQLNYEAVKSNLIHELTDPLVDVVNRYFFTYDPATKRLTVGPCTKR